MASIRWSYPSVKTSLSAEMVSYPLAVPPRESWEGIQQDRSYAHNRTRRGVRVADGDGLEMCRYIYHQAQYSTVVLEKQSLFHA